MRRPGRVNSQWETPLGDNFKWEHVMIEVLMELCDAAISYAGDTGLSQDAWLWDKIHALSNASMNGSGNPERL